MLCKVLVSKLDGQGIRNVALTGEGWDLEKVGHFGKVFVHRKGLELLNGTVLPEEDRKELENRIRTVDWVRDVINAPAEELGTRAISKTRY